MKPSIAAVPRRKIGGKPQHIEWEAAKGSVAKLLTAVGARHGESTMQPIGNFEAS